MKKAKTIFISIILANFILLAPIGNQTQALANGEETDCEQLLEDCEDTNPYNPFVQTYQWLAFNAGCASAVDLICNTEVEEN